MIWEIKSLEGIDAFIHEGEKNVPGLRERKKGHELQGEWAAELSEPCAGRWDAVQKRLKETIALNQHVPGKDNCFNFRTPVFLNHQLSHSFPSGWRCFNGVQLIPGNHLESWKGAMDTCLVQEHFCPLLVERRATCQTSTRSQEMWDRNRSRCLP